MNGKLLRKLKYLAAMSFIALLGACSSMHPTALNSSSGYTTVSQKSAAPPRPSYSFADSRPATGNNVFIFDPTQYAWAAYDANGQLVRDGIASGGRGYCSDIDSACYTPSGVYHVYRKGSSDCESSKFPIGKGGAPMPYCMFFKGGFAVHGSYDVPGYNASHGCVRVTPSDAAWLSQNFMKIGTTVIIKSYH